MVNPGLLLVGCFPPGPIPARCASVRLRTPPAGNFSASNTTSRKLLSQLAMARLLLLRVVSVLLLGHLGIALPPPAPAVSSSSSHSLRYFYTAASEDNKLLSSFIIVGYVDDQRICQYDSTVKEQRPCVPWMSKVEEEDPSYWAEETEVSRISEVFFKESLVTARNRYNQSGGFHTLQQMYGCDLRKDGSKAGYRQYAYNGKDFISFDKETLTWTAADVEAQTTKRKWDAQYTRNQYLKAYLEEECIGWLQKYLEYGKETLLRTGEGVSPRA